MAMTDKPKFETHEAYIASVPLPVQTLLLAIQSEVESRVPQATKVISYGLPAFRLQRVFFYFAAFKNHIGVYPPVTADAALIVETTPYRNEKGNLRFPLSQPLPLDLIGRIAEALAAQYAHL